MALSTGMNKSASQCADTSTEISESLIAADADRSELPILISSPQSYLKIGQEKMRSGEFSQSKKAFQEAYLAFEVIFFC